jgi:glycosyltransferase involved in cell wall biosynthesis
MMPNERVPRLPTDRMFSIIIPTHDSERPLVCTLAALVPGATAGLVREVIVADGGSRDETEQVADIAGCLFLSSRELIGARLKAAADQARGEWLMFVRPGVVPGPTWIDDVVVLLQQEATGPAVFSSERRGFMSQLFTRLPHPDQGLILPKLLYAEIGGHRPIVSDPETDLLRRFGRSRLTTLKTEATRIDI